MGGVQDYNHRDGSGHVKKMYLGRIASYWYNFYKNICTKHEISCLKLRQKKVCNGFKNSDFLHLDGARSVSIDFQYDILCWYMFVLCCSCVVARRGGLNYVLVVGVVYICFCPRIC